MIHSSLYNKIYNKMETISKKLKLKLIIEQSIKIKSTNFNKSRFVFTLSNCTSDNIDIIQNNLSYIKNILNIHNIPKFKKGFIIEFIYGIDIEDKRTKVYINVANNNNSVIFAHIYKNNDFNNYTKRNYIYKSGFYNKYPNSKFVKLFKKHGNNDIINNYFLIYQNDKFHAISIRTMLLNNHNIKNLILYLFNSFKLQTYNQNIIHYLNNKFAHLTNITINNTLDEINLYFNL